MFAKVNDMGIDKAMANERRPRLAIACFFCLLLLLFMLLSGCSFGFVLCLSSCDESMIFDRECVCVFCLERERM